MRMHKSRSTFFILLAVVALMAGCASKPKISQWPAISDPATGEHTPGRWVWAELFTDDVDAAKTFYAQAFAWEFEQIGSGDGAYTLIRNNGSAIAGIIYHQKKNQTGSSGRWLGLMSVADVGSAVSQATNVGGKVLVQPKHLKGRGETAVLADPEGALFGVIRSDSGDPSDIFPPFNGWLWSELWAHNADSMAEFYSKVGGYQTKAVQSADEPSEVYLVAGDYPRAGIVELERKDIPSNWLPYVRVQNLEQTLARITAAGGELLIAPSPEVRQGKVAIVADPLGAVFGVAQWSDEIARSEP
ncbi:VOC family protein [Kaarinaea lacus]